MSTRRRKGDPVTLSQRERDILKVLAPVVLGQRTQLEAARLLDITPRHTTGGRAAASRGPWSTGSTTPPAASSPASTRARRSGPTSTCSAAGYAAAAGPRPCTPTATASSSTGARAAATPRG